MELARGGGSAECIWGGNRKEFMFSSAMRAEESENGENSANAVSAQDDGAAINTISGMFATPEELTVTLTPLSGGHFRNLAFVKLPPIMFYDPK